MIGLGILSLFLQVGTYGSLAQDSNSDSTDGLTIDQIGPIGNDEPVRQITSENGDVASQVNTEARANISPQQAGNKDQDFTPSSQLTAERASAGGFTQLAPAERSAVSSAPLSNTGQSAPGAVARLEGNDRCDPQSNSVMTIALCKKVIEQRAEEFARQRATLSPEQRLLADQSQRNSSVDDKGSLIRRIGRNADADARETQEIASLVLPGSPVDRPVPTEDLPVDSDAAALADLITAIGVAAGASPPPQ